MKRILILVAIGLSLCSTASAFQGGGGEKTKRGSNKKNADAKKKSNVTLPKELILQMARDDDRVRSSLQEQGGNTVKFAANNFGAELLDLNRDGKPEWFIHGSSSDFCGNRVCWSSIYREVAGKYELLLADGGVPLSTFTNGYKDLEVGFGPYTPTIYIYDGKKYKEGYSFTLNQIMVPSKLGEIKNLVCNDSKKRLVQTKNRVIKSMRDLRGGWNGGPELWYESYEGGWQEKMKKECWEIQLEKFKVSNNGISFFYDTTIGFPMAILSEEPSSEYSLFVGSLKTILNAIEPDLNLGEVRKSYSILNRLEESTQCDFGPAPRGNQSLKELCQHKWRASDEENLHSSSHQLSLVLDSQRRSGRWR